jgi:broad specificity phosphatase PhoE
MALIYFVRHAQASFGAANYDQLSELGHRQSRWLGEYFALRGVNFSKVLAGTLVRQRETASGILAAMGRDPSAFDTHAGLDEYHGEALYAAYTGGADPRARQRADYKGYWRTFRAAMQAWADDRLSGVPETWGDFGRRTLQALSVAAEGAGRDDAVLVVSSGGAIGRAVSAIVGCPAATAIEFNLQFRNTAYCELIAGGGTLRLLSFNTMPHLEHPERRHAVTFA